MRIGTSIVKKGLLNVTKIPCPISSLAIYYVALAILHLNPQLVGLQNDIIFMELPRTVGPSKIFIIFFYIALIFGG